MYVLLYLYYKRCLNRKSHFPERKELKNRKTRNILPNDRNVKFIFFNFVIIIIQSVFVNLEDLRKMEIPDFLFKIIIFGEASKITLLKVWL